MYRAKQFADLAGVTVRALHHYDRLVLLKPSGRTDAGYRLYHRSDLEKLEQIVVLKHPGVPLRQIRQLLEQRPSDLLAVLRAQKSALERQRRRIDLAIEAIAAAEHTAAGGSEPDWKAFQAIIEVFEMENKTDWTANYYDSEAKAKVEERKALWTPELQARVSRQWEELTRDIQAAMAKGEKPEGERAQTLADRWRELVRGFTGGDSRVQTGLNEMWKDQENWPAEARQRVPFGVDVSEFIQKAMAAGSGR